MSAKVRLLRLVQVCLSAALVLILSSVTRPALAERMVFHNIFQNNKKVEHQLSGINHIVQDESGFMWFGSEKGLARYDGSHTRIYRHDPKDPSTLANDFIRGLLIDRQGVIWVATEAGLCSYHAQVDSFSCSRELTAGEWPRDIVRALALDHEDNVYFGTDNGLYKIAKDRDQIDQLSLYIAAEGLSSQMSVNAIAVDEQSALWVGTEENGLIYLNPRTRATRHFSASSHRPNALTHNRVTALEFDTENRLWVGTYGGGISILDIERTGFENHVYRGNQAGTLSSNIIWDIFTDSQGTVWLAVDQGGLVRFDTEKGFIATRHKYYDTASLTSDQVRIIYEDTNGDLWLGAFPSGVSFHNRSTGRVQSFKQEPDNSTSLSHSSILAIHQDANHNIWIGTEDGLNVFDEASGSFTRYQFNRGTALTAKAVLSIEQYDDDTLWIGTWSGGLLAFDLNDRTFHSIDTGELSGTGKNSMFIWDIMRDRNGDMWITTEFEGVGRYDRASDKFRFFTRNPENPNMLPSNFAWAIIEDRQGAIWIATSSGLAILRPGDAKPSQFQRGQNGLQADRILALYEDQQGRVWVGTQDNGVFIYHPETAYFQHIGADQGLPPGLSSGFIEDTQGAIWILTTNGLVKADGESLELQVFGTENGLASNSFNRNAAISSSGRLYIGGVDGLSVFDPADLGDDLREFPVWITGMRILNQEVTVGAENSPLGQSIHLTKALTLNHRDSMFSFDFAALDYRHSQDTRYAYMLKGFDQGWNHIGTNRSATYTNIPPGSYTFRVKASRGKSAWTAPKNLRIFIKPAPWQSWWAYLGYAVSGLTAAYFFFHYFQLRGHTRLYKSLSATDALTGVANRMGVTQAAKLLFDKAQPDSICLIFIDIDHFKRINDTRGHDSGDRILIEVADALRQCLRKSDLVGRWGGEEFLVVYSYMDQANGIRLAENIRREVAQRLFDHENSPLKVTLSLGCAFVKEGEHFEAAVKRADQALYQAKNAGRNCVVVADA